MSAFKSWKRTRLFICGAAAAGVAWVATSQLRHERHPTDAVTDGTRPTLQAGPGQGRAVATEARSLTLRVEPRFHGQLLALNDVSYRNAAGDLLGFTRIAFLLTRISLVDTTGKVVPLPDGEAYFDLGSGRAAVTLPALPAGRYQGIRFNVGVEPTRNHADPSSFAAGHPLNPLVNGLHWDWNGGFVFMALEGRYELADSTPGRLGGFVYHVANDENLAQVQVPIDVRVPGTSELVLALDLGKLVDGAVKVRISPARATDRTHSSQTDQLVSALVKAMPQSFSAGATRLADAPAAPPAGDPRAKPAATVAPAGLTRVQLVVPAGVPQPSLPPDNPLTEEGIALGRRLFFDPALSINRSQSCASCHAARSAFSDSGKAVSRGAQKVLGTRNAQPLFNLAWGSSFTWDGRRQRLRDQALAPIADHTEMALPSAAMLQRLSSSSSYLRDFQSVFGEGFITAGQVGMALEQYLLSLVSFNSKFDRALRREVLLTEQEKEGLKLFLSEHDPARGVRGADCFHCHGGALFTNGRFHNNGLDLGFKDRGRALVTGRADDEGLFKTPSLRNVALTGPYMHDGRFKTLEQVLEHYSSGTKPSATLDPNIAKHPNQAGVGLTKEEQAAVVAFLKTLTDLQFVGTPKASSPPTAPIQKTNFWQSPDDRLSGKSR